VFCANLTNECAQTGGFYNMNTSSSFRFVNGNFSIQYADFDEASGIYALETFGIGSTLTFVVACLMLDATVKNLEFGVGLVSNFTPGVMGIGYRPNEAIVEFNLSTYPNLIDQMFAQELVESRTYSLYLNDLEASTGAILFGGVDLEGFNGTLQTFPINPPANGSLSAFWITLTGMTLNPPVSGLNGSTSLGNSSSNHANSSILLGGSSVYPANVLLDSGTTLILLPIPIADDVADFFGAVLDESAGFYNLPNCDLQFTQSGTVDVDFSGVKITVPLSELILQDLYGNGSDICSSAYVVYDLVFSSFSSF
jgi:hypothetical protein